MSETPPVTSKPSHWRRAIRPLIWWSIMVLLMFAYRTHQRLSARTTIRFEPSLAGKSLGYEAEARFDGQSLMSGQRVPIGWHTLTVSHPKTKTFSTNLFVWYGQHDLGGIELERATGVLVVNASPAAHYLTIRGPEFSVTLTNSLGITSSVPTDRYVVEVAYKYWQQKEAVTVYLEIIPKLVQTLAEDMTAAKGVKLVRQYERSPVLGELYKPVLEKRESPKLAD